MPAIVQQIVCIVGELTAFRAVGSDGWGVGCVTAAKDGERHAITGKLLGVQVGDTIEIEGTWVESERYGEQFKVRRCTATTPQTDRGLIAWLSTLPNLGDSRARELVAAFGDTLWAVIERDPAQLCVVSGITPARAEAIAAAYHANRANRDHMILLRGWGLTDNQIARCVERWETLPDVVEAIRFNPYQLSQCVYGFGFMRADKVAMAAGVPYDSPQRIHAALEHVLEEAVANDGHMYMPSGALRARTSKLIGVPAEYVAQQMRAAIRGGRMVRRGTRIYTRRLDEAEQTCADALLDLLGAA